MDGSPCGAAGTHHIIWDYDMRNGCICAEHAAEARRKWVFIGLHPYTVACASSGPNTRAFWLHKEDRCVLPGDDGYAAALAAEAAARG
jgi:hypothetical protein